LNECVIECVASSHYSPVSNFKNSCQESP